MENSVAENKEKTKAIKSRGEKIFHIALFVFLLSVVIYVLLNLVFWKTGMPKYFFKYNVTENDTIELDYYSGPFFMLAIPETIVGKTVTSIGSDLFEEPYFDNGKISDIIDNPIKPYVAAVYLPDTLEEIHVFAFKDCTALRKINMPKNLKYIGSKILAGSKVRKLVFPEGITEIGCGNDVDLENYHIYESFSGMKYLNEVTFPESLKKIGNNAFSECPALKSITMPDGVEEIEYGAFQGSGITEANIPKSLTNNCGRCFIGTPFEDILAEKAAGDLIIFNDTVVYKYVGDGGKVVIPDGIETISDRAFWTGAKISTVEIPKSVKNIGRAFEFSQVESLVIPDTVDTEGDISFYGCSELKEIVLPDSMTKIPRSCFENCISLKNVNIPNNTRVIEEFAFENCQSLIKLNIPAGVDEIEYCAFNECIALSDLVMEGKPSWDKKAFENCTHLQVAVIDGETYKADDMRYMADGQY